MPNKIKYAPFSFNQLKVLGWWAVPDFKDYETIICDGSVRSGKTMSMSLSYIVWSMNQFSDSQFGMAGKTIGSLRRNVIVPLKQIIEPRGYQIKDKRASNALEISFGGRTNLYYLFGGKDESSQDLVQGLTTAGFFFDEVALMPQSFVNQAVTRASIEGSRLWFNCNPAGPYHWFKLEWIDKLAEHKALRLHFTMKDNLSLSKKILERYENEFSGVFYQRYIEGLWVMSDGIVYDNFDQAQMVTEKPDDNDITKYFVSCDYGAQNPTVLLLWGLSGNIWYCLKEYYYDARHDLTGVQKTDQQYADDLDEFIGSRSAPIIVDPAAQNFIIELESRGFEVYQAKNNVLDGIRLTQSLMSNGEIKFTPNLNNLFKEFASYVWSDKASQRGADVPVKAHDHVMDALRYFCATILVPNIDSGFIMDGQRKY